MVDEARYLSNHKSRAFEADRKLRLMGINFVSAGLLEGTIKEKEREPPTTVDEPSQSPKPAADSPASTMQTMEKLTIRSPSPSPSNSSEEEVVFRGRGASANPIKQSLTPSPSPAPAMPATPRPDIVDSASNVPALNTPAAPALERSTVSSTLTVIESTSHVAPSATSQSEPAARDGEPIARSGDPSARSDGPAARSGEPTLVSPGDTDSDGDSVINDLFDKRLGGKSVWDNNTTPWVSRSKPGIGWLPPHERPDMDAFFRGEVNPAKAVMEDYMQNMKEFLGVPEDESAAQHTFARRDLDLDLDGDENNASGEVLKDTSGDFRALGDNSDWDSVALFDLKSLGTSSDVMEPVDRILASRQRKTGIQYLVVYEGSVADDAHWLPSSFLIKPSDLALINAFEAEMLSRAQFRGSNSESDYDSDEVEIDDEVDDDDEEEDDYEVHFNAADIDDDERLARILQKQEELGLGSSEVQLFAADEFFDGAVRTPKGSSGSMGIDRPHKKRQQRTGKRSQPLFPSASAMADALDMDPYNGFDVMDTERPSLRPRKKGRRGQPPPELDDPELNEQVQASWEADRVKKRLKKAEREELRKQGLLGRKGKGADLSAKYKDGFTMDQVVEEIRDFMSSDMATCSLPPMGAHQRALVHQFVHHFGINSRSRGDGMNRFTILSKTSQTMQFDDDHFDAVIDRKKYKARFQASSRGTPKGNKVKPVVSYKDGEIVGASAPEIGPENRGRALLEKMGWKKGTALGTVDNKGILHPIAHTVKISKAGLK